MCPGSVVPGIDQRDISSKEVDLLFRISEFLHSLNTSKGRFLEVMRVMDETYGKRYGTLTLFDGPNGEVLLELAYGDPSDGKGNLQPLDPALVGDILDHRQPLAVNRITQTPIPMPAKSVEDKERCLLCLPVFNSSGVIGAIGMNPIYQNTVSFEKDTRLLKIVSSMAFGDSPLPADVPTRVKDSDGDPPLDRILEGKLKQIIEKVDPRTESHCALLPDILNLVEKIVIKWALKRHGSNQTATAHFLGINRNTLRKKMNELNIQPRRF
jgi:DNA-binding protein Fis